MNSDKVMPHKSRNRFLATSNCGRLQAQRDDPFTLRDANLTFYAELDSKLSPTFVAFEFDTYSGYMGLDLLTLKS